MAEKMGTRFSREGHELEVVVEARALERQLKEARVTLASPPGKTFTIACDQRTTADATGVMGAAKSRRDPWV